MPAKLKSLILAGGHSRRMGTNKARLEYHGKSQVAHCAELLESLDLSPLVATNDESFLSVAPLLKDFAPNMGPAGGLLAAQDNDPKVGWLVLACDMPFIDREILKKLVSQRNPKKAATVYRANDQIEPLLAIWEPLALEALWQFGLSPLQTLQKLDCQMIESRTAHVFESINTPEQRRKALRWLNQRETPVLYAQ